MKHHGYIVGLEKGGVQRVRCPCFCAHSNLPSLVTQSVEWSSYSLSSTFCRDWCSRSSLRNVSIYNLSCVWSWGDCGRRVLETRPRRLVHSLPVTAIQRWDSACLQRIISMLWLFGAGGLGKKLAQMMSDRGDSVGVHDRCDVLPFYVKLGWIVKERRETDMLTVLLPPSYATYSSAHSWTW